MKKSILGLPFKKIIAGIRRIQSLVSGDLWLAMLSTDDATLRRILAPWQELFSGKSAVALPPFEEPPSHLKARKILGKHFLGVAAAERHIRPFTAEEREEHQLLRIRDHRTGEFLTEEETLVILEKCKGEFVLCAMHRQNLLDTHGLKPERFNDPLSPWFGEQRQLMAFSSVPNPDPWVLVRIAPTPKSNLKDAGQQKTHLGENFSNERFVLPVEFAEVAIILFGETKEKLGGKAIIRFLVQTANGYWVRVNWHGDQLYFNCWYANADDGVCTLSARTS